MTVSKITTAEEAVRLIRCATSLGGVDTCSPTGGQHESDGRPIRAHAFGQIPTAHARAHTDI